jgi:hypothetical protein
MMSLVLLLVMLNEVSVKLSYSLCCCRKGTWPWCLILGIEQSAADEQVSDDEGVNFWRY